MSSSLNRPGFAEITITDLTVSVRIQSSIVNLKSPIVFIKDRSHSTPSTEVVPATVRVEPANKQYYYIANFITNSIVNTAVFDGNRVSAGIQVLGFRSEYSQEVVSHLFIC